MRATLQAWSRALAVTACVGLTSTCTRAQDEYASQCPAEPKTCDDRCVAIDDPAFGCGEELCDPCQLADAVPVCSAGICVIGTCHDDRGDCDGVQGNGCETDLEGDAQNCGSCGNACGGQGEVACVAGECVIESCNVGFDDCDDDAHNGCETPVLADTENCGMCGRDCGGGGCEAGKCETVVVFTGSVGVHEPMSLAIDSTHIYWANDLDGNDGAVYRININATDEVPGPSVPETIVSNLVQPHGVAVDDRNLYVSAYGNGVAGTRGVFWGDKSGTNFPRISVAGAFAQPSGMVLSDGYLYWANWGTGSGFSAAQGVWRVAIREPPPNPEIFHVCESCDAVTDVASDGSRIYWPMYRDAGEIQGKTYAFQDVQIQRQQEPLPRFVAADDNFIYWTSSDETGALRFADKSLSKASDLITGLNFPAGVAVDDTFVYIAERDALRIVKITKPVK